MSAPALLKSAVFRRQLTPDLPNADQVSTDVRALI